MTITVGFNYLRRFSWCFVFFVFVKLNINDEDNNDDDDADDGVAVTLSKYSTYVLYCSFERVSNLN